MIDSGEPQLKGIITNAPEGNTDTLFKDLKPTTPREGELSVDSYALKTKNPNRFDSVKPSNDEKPVTIIDDGKPKFH
jgi:hypothetical protein